MTLRTLKFALLVLVLLAGGSVAAQAQTAASKAAPSKAIPTMSLEDVSRHGFFYAGGEYVGEGDNKTMGHAMYVEVMVPKQIRHPYPVVFFHGAGQTGVDWLQTPDGRPGWAYYLLKQGYVVYMEDYPTRGRSMYVPGVDGTADKLNLNIRTAPNLQQIFTASALKGDFPRAKKHTQFPGTGLMGDPTFDNFAKTQVQFLAGGPQDKLVRDANVALLDMIGTPVILFTHSQGGAFGWLVADARPKLVKAVVTVEPAGPPIKGVDTAKVAYTDAGGLTWGVTGSPITYDPPISQPSELKTYLETKSERPDEVPCYLQQAPVRKLKNLENIPVLDISADGGYHRVFDVCLAKWLNQAGVKTQFVRMEDVGLVGNGHEMFFEKNSDEIIKYLEGWMRKQDGMRPDLTKAMPGKNIPTFPTDTIARKGFFYAGGAYWGTAGQEVMRGSMYTEVWVPKQIRQPYPVVIFHGNGQTGVDWQQTPDNREGWAYYLMSQGYVTYWVDYPARGRSAYVPLPGPNGQPIDGALGIRSAKDLEEIWTNVNEMGDFPLKDKHTQWPGTGKPGDPYFDNFIKTQVQFAGQSIALARDAGMALLDMIGTPVILMTHSQGGGLGFDVFEGRPNLVKAMVAIEPGGPQFGGVNTATVEPGPRNPNSWGLTGTEMKYDPPADRPSDLKAVLEDKSDRPGEVRCWMQQEPARKLVNWQNVKILDISGGGTYHRVYDPCMPKFMKQAGVDVQFSRLEDVGIPGNGHEMMLEKNSDDVIKYIDGWLQKNVIQAGTTQRSAR